MSERRKAKSRFDNVEFINRSAIADEANYSSYDVIYIYNPITRIPGFYR